MPKEEFIFDKPTEKPDFWITLLFVGLKLSDHIDWSWWWVLSPSWIMLIVGLVIGGVKAAFKK